VDKYQHDIERYLRGELTPEERHRLEKKALDDPFLMDALEGAEMVSSSFSSDVDFLRNNLNSRFGKRHFWYGWPMRVAAGLAILAVVSGVLYFFLPNQNSETLALNEENKEIIKDESLIQKEKKTEITADDSIPVAEQSPSSVGTTKKNPVAIKPKASRETIPTLSKSQPEVFVEENAVSMSIEKAESKPEEHITADVILDQSVIEQENVVAKKSSIDKGRYKIVQGKVTDDQGEVLAGVKVSLENEVQGTVTDLEGKYTIQVLDTTSNLIFSFIGMETIVQAIPKTGPLNVALEADVSSLSEIVVVGYGSKNMESEIPTYEFASPEGGRTAYKQYLTTHLKYPTQAIENNVEGRVTIQFNVDQNGNTSDFRVIRGIGYGCDEEVIRLIKEGPKWSSSKRDGEHVSDRVRVRVRFKLPKK
jgi:TonB family protein